MTSDRGGRDTGPRHSDSSFPRPPGVEPAPIIVEDHSMTGLAWLRRRGPCCIETRALSDWQVVHVKGKFVAGEPEKKFLAAVDGLLQSRAARVVVDLTASLLAGDSVATGAPAAHDQARR